MFVLVSNNCQKVPSFHFESTHFQGTLIKTEYILTDLRKKRTHCKKSTLAFGDCFATFFVFFYFSTKKKLYSLSHSEKFGFAFAKFTSTSRLFFSSSLYIVQKVTFVKPSLFAEPPPFTPRWLVFPGLLFYLHLLVCFIFFLRFFKLIFFVFSHFVDVVSVNCYVNVCVFVSVTLAINIRSVAFVFRYRIFSLFCFVKVYSFFSRVLVQF